MAQYRAVICGGRGEASRLGHKTNGIRALVQSYSGDVAVQFSWDEESQSDWCLIRIQPHSTGAGYTVFNGPIQELLSLQGRKAMIRQFAEEELRHQYASTREDDLPF